MSSLEKPLCECHGEPMSWNRDVRGRMGGFWRCAIKRRAYERNKRATDPAYAARVRKQHNEWQTKKYDADPLWRIGRRLREDAYTRSQRLEQTRRALHG